MHLYIEYYVFRYPVLCMRFMLCTLCYIMMDQIWTIANKRNQIGDLKIYF